MAFHIKNPETDALARRVAALKKIGLTEAVHVSLQRELEREENRPSKLEELIRFTRDFRAGGDPAKKLPADKDFIDSLYEDD
jgi:antitoxin VapB